VATWSADAIAGHDRASKLVARIKDEAFTRVASAVSSEKPASECEIAEFIRARFAEEGLESSDGPIVAVNGHAGDPHFSPDPSRDTPIRRGDWLLIDLWARVPGEQNIFSDITWVAVVGGSVSSEQQRAFDAVRSARDAALQLAQRSWRDGTSVQGWQLDDAARTVLVNAGYADAIRHRTGHSLSPGANVHGVGMNLDGVETRDTRSMIANTGFTIEPGVYFPHFGVRLEINVFVDPARGPVVTSCIQDEMVRLG
jgi:Xaa-Pro aminopeptidase